MSSDKSRTYFKKFVKDWNKGKLSKKYYDGIRPSQVASSNGTRYKWSFAKKMDQYELDTIRDSIDTATNVKFPTEVAHRAGLENGKDSMKREKRVIGPSMPSNSYDEDMDEEDRIRYERALRKKDQKHFSKSRDADLEELVPKETGREAMLEKRRANNAFHRRERSPDVELPDSELMGGDDFHSRLAAEKRRHENRNARQQQIRAEKAALNQEKLMAYQAKENATIEMFRKMAEQNQLMQHRPPQ
ncbi:hypothetical protein K493DRAFT_335248 [Basidiobolus meristosporus CBS 931.73]|uniref:Uncharacterized protein n=1 Tax=Basidiobolus meristosporus CBS 931.73 TaxID=1314790 RepID=A0A1Y1YRT6_9FUNG|nr:hypothetical protein K493DRAFT_335248 [Basidiobolus meristosporus CBS 931.73]|eukprot:ORY00679.1 hypothetical protein K493DRAFT_335248 [Basidiobolus meristosporus CBS 931.73]